jgi:hypothetical protein
LASLDDDTAFASKLTSFGILAYSPCYKEPLHLQPTLAKETRCPPHMHGRCSSPTGEKNKFEHHNQNLKKPKNFRKQITTLSIVLLLVIKHKTKQVLA